MVTDVLSGCNTNLDLMPGILMDGHRPLSLLAEDAFEDATRISLALS